MKSPRSRASFAMPTEDTATELGSRLFEVLPGSTPTRLHGAKTVTATFSNGRTVWLNIRPQSASIAEVNRLARAVEMSDARQAFTARSQALAIKKLAQRLDASTERMGERSLARQKQLAARIAAGDAKVDAKITKAAAEVVVRERKEERKLVANIHRLRRRSVWDSLVIASAVPLFAAYGEDDGRFAGGRNLTLFISLMIWLVGDEIADAIAGDRDPEVIRDTDFWSYLAPFANLLTGWLLLHNTQRERFVTGSAQLELIGREENSDRSIVYTYAAEVELFDENGIALEHQDDFLGFENVRVIATVTDPEIAAPTYSTTGVSAKVVQDRLLLEARIIVPPPATTTTKSAPRLTDASPGMTGRERIDPETGEVTWEPVTSGPPAVAPAAPHAARTSQLPFPTIQVAWAVDTNKPSP